MTIHHLIGVSSAGKHQPLLVAAARVGWNMDEADNIVLMP
jgi:hypothetical protein